jgi:hypothetical protein
MLTSGDESTCLTEYEVRHLATHLALGKMGAALHNLLGSYTPQGSNLWFGVKESFGDISGFLADVRLAWTLAEEGFSADGRSEQSETFSLQIRYSLMISSVRSLVRDLPSNLISALVAEGVWRSEQAAAYARQVADPYHRVILLSLIAPLVADPLRITLLKDALNDLDIIQGTYYRADALTHLAPHLPPDLLKDAYEYCRKESMEGSIDQALEGLAPFLPDNLIASVLDTAEALPSADSKVRVLVALAPRLPQSLREAIVKKACVAIPVIGEAHIRAFYLARVAPLVSKPSEAKELFLMAMTEVRSLERLLHFHPLRVLKEMLPQLPDDLIPEALEIARNIYHPDNRAEALISILPRLSRESGESIFKLALEEVRSLDRPYDRANLLLMLAEKTLEPLKSELLKEANTAISQINNKENGAWLTTELAQQLNGPQRRAALTAALQKARLINDETELAITRFTLARYLLPKGLPQWLDRLRAGGSENLVTDILKQVVQHLNEEQLLDVLAMARDGIFGHQTPTALRLLTPHLSTQHLKQVIVLTSQVDDIRERATLLTDLLPCLEGNLKRNVIDEVMALIPQVFYDRDDILQKLYPQMPRDYLLRLLKEASEEEYRAWRAHKLAMMLEYLPEQMRSQIAQMVFDDIGEVADPVSRASLLVKIGPHLPRPLLEEILATPPLESEYSGDESLIELIPHLPDGVITKLVRASVKVRDPRFRYWVLAEIYPLVVNGQQAAIQKALDERHYYIPDRVLLLSELSMHIPGSIIRELESWSHKVSVTVASVLLRSRMATNAPEPLRSRVLLTALEDSRQLKDAYLRVHCLTNLAQCFNSPDQTLIYQQTSRDLLAIHDQAKFATSLRQLVPNLAADVLPAVIDKALTFAESHCAACLLLLIPFASTPQQLKIAEALQAFSFTKSESFSSFGDYYSAVASELVPRLTEEFYELVIGLVRQRPALERAERLARLLVPSEHYSNELLYSCFKEVLHLRSEQDRINLLKDLHSLGHNMIVKLAGAGSVEATFESLKRVGEWWP